jgi:hypothetical protein
VAEYVILFCKVFQHFQTHTHTQNTEMVRRLKSEVQVATMSTTEIDQMKLHFKQQQHYATSTKSIIEQHPKTCTDNSQNSSATVHVDIKKRVVVKRRVSRSSTITFPLPTILEETENMFMTQKKTFVPERRMSMQSLKTLQLKNDFGLLNKNKSHSCDKRPTKPQRSSDTAVELINVAISIISVHCDDTNCV